MRKIFIIILVIFSSVFYYNYHTTTVYIIRHGEKVIKTGLSDAPLTAEGKIQAEKLGKYLASRKIPHLYASPMRRARQTAEIIAMQTGSSISFDDRLTEKNYRKSPDLYPDGTNIYVQFLADGSKETASQHLERLLSFFKDSAGIFNKQLYIVAHGGLINRILEKISIDSHKPLQKIKVGYCSVFSFKYNKITQSFSYLDHFELDDLED